ncbi:hypothetical protein [Pontibacter sp. BAB1700]|uniref:SDH family Clp fold serine proteinase n=1 Tax=Pontibacter sp. BAB1700 TaxID=1144253 RepID=UPI00031F5CAE|nr:hypothetical protein [Pontibacter sp. BAB1700]
MKSNAKIWQWPSLLLLALLFSFTAALAQEQQRQKVFIMEITSEIDPRTNRYTQLALDEATRVEADHVLLKLNTYGGAVNDADAIRLRLLEYPKPIYVFIDKNAASAGALISIACDSIYMAPGANIGAATVVVPTGRPHQASTRATCAPSCAPLPRQTDAIPDWPKPWLTPP